MGLAQADQAMTDVEHRLYQHLQATLDGGAHHPIS
jgi:hypothetical protein